MGKNNQLPIFAAIIIGAILAVALVLILTRDNPKTTEIAPEDNTSENTENGGGEENGSNGRQPENPEGPEQPSNPEGPETGELPSNWHELTGVQKTQLNPFGCDLETQHVRSDNGLCQDKQAPAPKPWPIEHTVLIRVAKCPDIDPVFQYSCQRRPRVSVAIKGAPTAAELDELWSAYLERYYSCEGSGLDLSIYDHNGSDDWQDYSGQTRKTYECRQGVEYVELNAQALCSSLRQLGPNCSKGGDAVPYITHIVVAVKDDPSDQALEKFFGDFVESYPACGHEPEGLDLVVLDYDGSDETGDYGFGIFNRQKKHFGCRGDVEYVFLRSGGLCVDFVDGGGYCTTELYVAVRDNPSDEELERFASFYLEEYKWQPGFSLSVYDHNGSNNPDDYDLYRYDETGSQPRRVFHGGTDLPDS